MSVTLTVPDTISFTSSGVATMVANTTDLNITGNGGTAGGNVTITAGSDSDGAGGAASLIGGASSLNTTGVGGAVAITGGAASGTGATTGGAINITGGAGPATTGVGGAINITSGDGGSASGDAGDVIITAGTAAGAGADGVLQIVQAAAGTALTYTWPVDTPTNGQVLEANIAGQDVTLSWEDPTGATSPGAPLNSIQFNSGGSFAGSSTLLFDGTNTVTFGTENATATLTAPDGGAATNGGSLSLLAGAPASGSADGGDVTITAGTAGAAGGTGGDVIISGGGAGGGTAGVVLFPNLRSGVSANAAGIVSGTGELVDTVSLRKYKKDEVLLTEEPEYDVEMVLNLKPKFFTWKEDEKRDLGFIVEDTLEVHKNFIYFEDTDEGPVPHNIKDRAIIAALVGMVKKQDAQIKDLMKDIAEIKAML